MTITDAARDLVRRTCRAQELPEHVEDRAILRQVAAIVAARRDAAPGHSRADAITVTTTDPTGTEGGAIRGPA